MDLAVHNLNFTVPGGPEAIGPALLATARAAEEGGVSQFTVMDHYFQMDWMAPAEDPMLEGYTTLGYLAGVTQTMRLGLLVTGRHPVGQPHLVPLPDRPLEAVAQPGRDVRLLGAGVERRHGPDHDRCR